MRGWQGANQGGHAERGVEMSFFCSLSKDAKSRGGFLLLLEMHLRVLRALCG